jgi:hypothetical protein
MPKSYFCIFIAILLLGCRGPEQDPLAFIPPVFPETVEVTPAYLETDMISSQPIDMHIRDTAILIISYDGKYLLQAIDKRSGKHISGMIHRGRGPGEMSGIQTLSVLGDAIYAYSIMEAKMQIYHSFSDYAAAQPDSVIYFGNRSVGAILPFKDRYVGWSRSIEKRYITFDKDGVETSAYSKYPELPGVSDMHTIRSIWWPSQLLRVKPDQSKFVVSRCRGAMLEIFSLAGDTISLLKEKRFYPPKVKVLERGEVESLPEEILGLTYAATTDKYIYAVFQGKSTFDTSVSDNWVYVFNWEGEPVRSYKVKGGVARIAFDAPERRMYIQTRTADGGEDRYGYFTVKEKE